MLCEFCWGNTVTTYCRHCEERWKQELKENDLPTRLAERTKRLSIEQREKVYTLEDSQRIRRYEREYGFDLSCADGDETKVIDKKIAMENGIRAIIDQSVARCERILSGQPEPMKPKPKTLYDYTNVRYGRDL